MMFAVQKYNSWMRSFVTKYTCETRREADDLHAEMEKWRWAGDTAEIRVVEVADLVKKPVEHTDTDCRVLCERRHAEYLADARQSFASGDRGRGFRILAMAAHERINAKFYYREWRLKDMRLIDGVKFLNSGGFTIEEVDAA